MGCLKESVVTHRNKTCNRGEKLIPEVTGRASAHERGSGSRLYMIRNLIIGY